MARSCGSGMEVLPQLPTDALPGGGGGGFSGYVALPAGILTNTKSITVECWVTQNAEVITGPRFGILAITAVKTSSCAHNQTRVVTAVT